MAIKQSQFKTKTRKGNFASASTNKAKKYRRAFSTKTGKYKSDSIDKVCTTFISRTAAMPDDTMGNGSLCPVANVAAGAAFTIQSTIALDARNPLLENPSHARVPPWKLTKNQVTGRQGSLRLLSATTSPRMIFSSNFIN